MSTKKRTLLLLGGSKQQVIAIERTRELGFRTVVCDYLPDNPGQYVADAFHLVSTTDKQAVLEVAKEEKVDGILAYASDPAAPTAAFVAEQLKLPGNPSEAVEVLSEKHLFRQHLRKTGLPCPRSISVTSDETAEEVAGKLGVFRWPVVVKPTDSSGSKGVSVVDSTKDLQEAIGYARAHSRNRILIIEEFIRRSYPHVVGGDVFVVDGDIVFWGLMDCLRENGTGGMVPVGKMLPCAASEAELEDVKKSLQRLVSSLGIRFGELNVEVIIGDDGRAHVLELGARAGGNMIPVQLSDASGCDLVAANILCAMGEDPAVPEWDSANGPARAHVVLRAAKQGAFRGVNYGDLAPHVYREVLYKDSGERVDAFTDAGDAVGIAFLKFGSSSEMRELLGAEDTSRWVVVG